MNKKRIMGLILIILSAVLALSNLTITGNVIGSSAPNYLSFIAIGIFTVGILILFFDEDLREEREEARKKYRDSTTIVRPGHRAKFKSRKTLKDEHKEARREMREIYEEEHGRYPTAQELREYIREAHEGGYLNDMIEDRRIKTK